jgi:hypothetical protein
MPSFWGMIFPYDERVRISKLNLIQKDHIRFTWTISAYEWVEHGAFKGQSLWTNYPIFE